jgi:hypothetical protein
MAVARVKCQQGYSYDRRYRQCLPTLQTMRRMMATGAIPFNTNFQYTPGWVSASNPTPAPTPVIYSPNWQVQPIPVIRPPVYYPQMQPSPMMPVPFEQRPYMPPSFDNSPVEQVSPDYDSLTQFEEGAPPGAGYDSAYDGLMGLGADTQPTSTLDKIRQYRDLALESYFLGKDASKGIRPGGTPVVVDTPAPAAGVSNGLVFGGIALLAVAMLAKMRK